MLKKIVQKYKLFQYLFQFHRKNVGTWRAASLHAQMCSYFFPHGRRFLLVRYSRIFHHIRGGAFSSHSTTFATVTEAWRDISDRPENIGIITNEFLTAMGALLKYRFVFLLL